MSGHVCAVCDHDIKWCPSCSRWLPLDSEFWHRDDARYDGFTSWCKQCRLRHDKYRKSPKVYEMLKKIGALSLTLALASCSFLDSAENRMAELKVPKAQVSKAVAAFQTWLDGLAVDAEGNITGDTMAYALPSLWKVIRDAYRNE